MLSGWLAFGWYDHDGDVFVEAEGYSRPEFTASRDIITLPRGPLIPEPVGAVINHGAVFDAQAKGHCLAFWSWQPDWFSVPGRLPAMLMSYEPTHVVQLAANATAGTDVVSKVAPERQAFIGRLNGAEVFAGVRLLIVGGTLVARARYVPRKSSAAA